MYNISKSGGLLVVDIFNKKETTITTIEGLGLNTIYGLVKGGGAPYGFIQLYDLDNMKTVETFDYGITEIYDFQIIDSLAFVLYRQGQDIGVMKVCF